MTQDVLDNWLNVEEGRRREKVLRRVSEVCAVPATAQRVLALAADSNSDVKQIAEAAAADAAIAAQLLRIANSPLFAHSRQIVDLKRAIVLIGRKELHSMAAAMAMLAAVKSETPLAKRLNNSSVLSATLARMTAKHLDKKMDEGMAFLSGLLCEIGALACLSIDGEGYSKIFEEAEGALEMLTTLERQRYGASSEDIGSDMLRRNLLPESVVKAVKTSLDDDIDSLELLQRITLFSRMAAPVIVNAAEEEESSAIAEHCHVLLENLKVGEIPEEILLDICMTAATSAELRLRGKPIE